ncbi:unnamed protein product (macronuclear) [Paramecium tetraurelia]|uniref:Uncharacterized protein n=1 Tax=Paramecium tetraurelia TaxID=5888 RepID=A0DLQ4_PARTE|nr:uncharacterized protein GSPATT00039603001 [Paramecium tetraurelia]CAK83971.1 unnamed protein product [Paramecium tetraurelia]|eukprot:XP_001451368.1 hypothetical protein (macronuclear) [Paramecium tetraurelia strain d4-2]
MSSGSRLDSLLQFKVGYVRNANSNKKLLNTSLFVKRHNKSLRFTTEQIKDLEF